MASYKVAVVEHSVAPNGRELVSFAVRMPRVVLAELNTHRQLCLAGDSVLEFDLPGGTRKGGYRRVHKMRIDEFVDKWINGARRTGANPKRSCDLSWIETDKSYPVGELASGMGMSGSTNLNNACRLGDLPAEKRNRVWWVLGRDFLVWRGRSPEHTRFDMRGKLSGMRIRQLNETTGDVQWSRVSDALYSGVKEVFQVTAGGYSVSGSSDHLVFTVSGWKRIGDLIQGVDKLIVRRFGKPEDEHNDPNRLRKINGAWRSVWQRKQRERMTANDPLCRRCRVAPVEDIHHVIPVYEDPSLAFAESNITALCESCHNTCHRKQGWQGGTRLYAAAVEVNVVVSRGSEHTYDLTISGNFPNFIANGVVVHNSRNTGSSRAMPMLSVVDGVEIGTIPEVEKNPYIPGPTPDGSPLCGNGKGMVATEPLDPENVRAGQEVYRAACRDAVFHARRLVQLGWHKQDVNRLIEPFQWVRTLITSTHWPNFFALRTDVRAYPPFRFIARCMYVAYRASRPDVKIWASEGGVGCDPRRYWHLPFIDSADVDEARRLAADNPGEVVPPGFRSAVDVRLAVWSAARCCRISGHKFGGGKDYAADVRTYRTLVESLPRHSSPLEHQAFTDPRAGGAYKPSNFGGGWVQHRKLIDQETTNEFAPTDDTVASWNLPDRADTGGVFAGVPGIDW